MPLDRDRTAVKKNTLRQRQGGTWSSFDGELEKPAKRYFDARQGVTVVKLYSGDCYIAEQPGEMLVTILGSCVAACIRDPITRVGGMNHFLLPAADEVNLRRASDAARYGAFAMEQLINGILKCGGRKERLEIKIFGGAHVIQSSDMIGERNITFVQQFLKAEGLTAASADVGGTTPRRVNYYPETGRVMLRRLLRRSDEETVSSEELQFSRQLRQAPLEGSIELFD